MGNKFLNQKQRLIISGIYLTVLIIIFQIMTGNIIKFLFTNNNDSRISFLIGALLLILGKYITESFFTRPADAIVNSITVIIALLGITSKNEFIGYYFLIIYSSVVFIFSLYAILLKDSRYGHIAYKIVEKIGKSKNIYSIVFLFSIFSYFAYNKYIVILFLFWIIVRYDFLKFVFNQERIKELLFDSNEITSVGTIQESEDGIYFGLISKNKKANEGDVCFINNKKNIFVGVIISKLEYISFDRLKLLMILEDSKPLRLNYKANEAFEKNSIYYEPNQVYKLDFDKISDEDKLRIENNAIFKRKDRFIGYITANSNIDIIKFKILEGRNNISEGDIIKTVIYDKEVFYQIIDGITNDEKAVEYNKTSYIVGIAKKLGKYKYETNELEHVKWLPKMYTPVYKYKSNNINDSILKNIADTSIGRLPQTDLKIPIKNMNYLITHNTAILGVLGVGKSCLSFELIKKAEINNIKIIVLDISNQYISSNSGLPRYIRENKIIKNLSEDTINTLKTSKEKTGSRSNPNEWGNEERYIDVLSKEIENFLQDERKSIFVMNPDNHQVTKAASKFNIEAIENLTIAEKTRLITEVVYKLLMEQGESIHAKTWLVYEEAHALIPEWNSVSSNSDKVATNGTAKCILQGRKFGLGCLLVTQRTANISKSILNQCNTIFGLRVYDDTGMNFLENYIGNHYASILPNLEERHAIVMGKGLELKKPVIIELNDKNYCEI